MSAYFRCDHCHTEVSPENLRKIVALIPLTYRGNVQFAEDLHTGELCLSCVNAVKAVLPQTTVEIRKEYGD